MGNSRTRLCSSKQTCFGVTPIADTMQSSREVPVKNFFLRHNNAAFVRLEHPLHERCFIPFGLVAASETIICNYQQETSSKRTKQLHTDHIFQTGQGYLLTQLTSHHFPNRSVCWQRDQARSDASSYARDCKFNAKL